MSNAVDTMSDEDFDKAFDTMMSQTPEEFDTAQGQTEETQLAESPIETEPDLQEEAQPEETPIKEDEQPQEELDTSSSEETVATEQPEEGEIKDPVVEDSKEPGEFDFSQVPQDKVIPKDINVNGMTVRATMAELEEGFKKGMNYTQKMQEIAPHRKDMNLMSENNLTTDDLNLLIEAKNGNKEALGKLLANAKLDPLDVETEGKEEYTPKDYSKEVPNVEMEQIKNTILSDTTNAPIVETALQSMPEDMYELVSANSNSMGALYKDVQQGVYQKVMPEVIKQQSLYGKTEPTLQTYLKVAAKFGENKQEVKQPEPTKVVENKQELNTKRKNAGTTVQSKKTPKESFIKEDLDGMSDEDFDKAFEKMVGRSIQDFN